MLVFDLDDLKRINDGAGHAAGDALLRAAAAILRAVLREDAAVARTGGGEFGVPLPGTTGGEAAAIAVRVRIALDRAGIRVPTRRCIRLTLRLTRPALRLSQSGMVG